MLHHLAFLFQEFRVLKEETLSLEIAGAWSYLQTFRGSSQFSTLEAPVLPWLLLMAWLQWSASKFLHNHFLKKKKKKKTTHGNGKEGDGTLISSVCWFPWCKYTHCGWYQATTWSHWTGSREVLHLTGSHKQVWTGLSVPLSGCQLSLAFSRTPQ